MIRQIARPLLGSVFVYSGIRALTNPAPVVDRAKPLIDTAAELDFPVASPQMDDQTLARAYGGVQLGAGLLLATGRLPRLASLVLAGSLAPAAVTQQFWAESDPAARQEKTMRFLKDASLMGGLLIAGFDTEGKPGVKWRARRLAAKASDRFSDDSHHIDVDEFVDKAKHAAAIAAERLGDGKEVAAERISEFVDAAKPRVEHAANVIAERASHAAAAAKPRLEQAAAVAGEKAGDAQAALGDAAVELRDRSKNVRAETKSRLRR